MNKETDANAKESQQPNKTNQQTSESISYEKKSVKMSHSRIEKTCKMVRTKNSRRMKVKQKVIKESRKDTIT